MSSSLEDLRSKAEKLLEKHPDKLKFEGQDIEILLRELSLHQVELEMQNEELETRLRERTAALEEANAALKAEIDERRQAEESEERLQALMSNNPSLVFMKDETGRYVYLNETYEKHFVHSKEWYGKTDFDFWPEKSAELFRANDADVLQSGRVQQFLEDSRDLTGKRYSWLCYKFPFYDSQGRCYVGGIGIDATARVEAEEALGESEARERQRAEELQTIFDTAPLGLAIALDADGGHIRGNRANELVYGLPPGAEFSKTAPQPVGFRVFEAGQELATAELPMQRAIGGETVSNHEIDVVLRDGRTVTVYAGAKPLLDETGRPRGAVGAFLDITERKRAEEALLLSEKRYRTLFNTMTEGFALHEIITDDQGRPSDYTFLDVNPAFERLTGLKRQDLIGRRVLEVMPETEPHWIESYGKVALLGEPLHLEEYSAVLGRWYSVFAYRTEPRRFAVIFSNVSDRRRAEEALRQSEARSRILHESLRDAFVQVDMEGRIIDCNEIYCRMLGYTPEELLTLTYEDLTPERWHDTEAAIVSEQIISRGYSDVYEKEYRRKDGSVFPVELRTILSRDDAGRPSTMWGVVRDITERKRTEEALLESEKLLSAFLEQSPVGLALLDKKGEIVKANIEYRRFVPEIMPSCDPSRQPRWRAWGRDGHLLGPSEFPGYRALRGEHVTPGIEFLFTDDNGEEMWTRVSAVPFRDETGEILGTVTAIQDINLPKRTSEALAAANREIQSITDNTPAIVYAFDLEERFLLANAAIAELLNSTPAQMIGKRRHEFMPKEDADRHEANDRLVIEAGTALEFEEYSLLDGRSITWLTTKFPLRDSQGRIYALAGISTDISQRKQMEEALREGEDRYRGVVENTTAIILRIAPSGVITFANQRSLDFFGYSAEELIGRHAVGTIVPPRETSGRNLAKMVEDIAADPEAFHTNANENICKDGRRVWLEWTNSGIYRPDGRLKEFLSVGIDATARKQAEEALRDSELKYTEELELRVEERTAELHQALQDLSNERRRLFDVFEALPAMVCLLTPDHRVAFANRSFREKFGEPEGRHCYEQCFGLKEPCDFCESFEPLKTGKPHHWEVNTPDGSVIDVYDFPFTDVDGSPMILEMDLDITDQRRLEEQLRQAQKMEAVGTLAGGIAHDFNNMLAVIIGNAEMALDDIESSGNVDGFEIEQILKASKRARDLVSQILTFSRKNVKQKRPLKVVPIIEESFNFLRASIPSTIEMEVDVSADSDTILADPSQVQQILVNLATNAAYAMRDDGGTLWISLSEELFVEGMPTPDAGMQPGKYLKLAVRDTGPGMSAAVSKRIFEPFFTTKEPGHGTGMGLAVVFGIVQSLGGAITVDSRLGRGSTFNVFFPVSEEAAEQEEREEGPLLTGRGKILVVDDEPSVLETVSAMLRRLGYKVTTAGNGPEGWKKFKAKPHQWDLVLTDHAMPGMAGMRLAEKMLELRNDIPVVLFTGYSETVSPEKAREAGIADFVMKPVTGKELARTLRRVMERKRVPGSGNDV